MSNEKPIEELEAPARELSAEESEEVTGGIGKVSLQDFHFATGITDGTSSTSFASGGGGGAGKVSMQDMH